MYRLTLPLACLTLAACAHSSAPASHPAGGPDRPAVNPVVLKHIEALHMPAPARTLNALDLTGTVTYQNTPAPLNVRAVITPDAATGQLAITTTTERYTSQEISWRGLLTLSAKRVANKSYTTDVMDSLSFEGDWQHLTVGSTVSYTRQGTLTVYLLGPTFKAPWTVDCTVDSESPARALNANLSGDAKALTCSERRANRPPTPPMHYNYLVDYGFFYHARTDKNDAIWQAVTIEQVQ